MQFNRMPKHATQRCDTNKPRQPSTFRQVAKDRTFFQGYAGRVAPNSVKAWAVHKSHPPAAFQALDDH